MSRHIDLTRHRPYLQGLAKVILADLTKELEQCRGEIEMNPKGFSCFTWNPIASAPKDGAIVLLFPSNLARNRYFFGSWSRDRKAWLAWLEPIKFTPTHWCELPVFADLSGLSP